MERLLSFLAHHCEFANRWDIRGTPIQIRAHICRKIPPGGLGTSKHTGSSHTRRESLKHGWIGICILVIWPLRGSHPGTNHGIGSQRVPPTAEGIHFLIKPYIRTSTFDLFDSWQVMRQAVTNQLKELNHIRVSQQTRTPLDVFGGMFEAVQGWVSYQALRKVQEQRKLALTPL